MRRRSATVSRISPIQVPSMSQWVNRGALKGDRKLEEYACQEEEAHWSHSRGLCRSRAHERGPACTGVILPHVDQSTHGFLLCSLFRVPVFTPMLSFSFSFFRLWALCMLAWPWGQTLKFLQNEIISNKKLNYRTSSQKGHPPIKEKKNKKNHNTESCLGRGIFCFSFKPIFYLNLL